jgi:Trypsin-like peptidase domain
LSKPERDALIALLKDVPGSANPFGRSVLLNGVPNALQHLLPVIGIAAIDITNMVDGLESPAGQLADGSWPITLVIENTFALLGGDSALALRLGELMDRASARSDALRVNKLDLQALINKHVAFNKAEPWAARYLEVLRTVCLVESQQPGTGFLVGPDLVMTNHHVVEGELGDPDKLKQIVVRFDYRVAADGRPLSEQPYALKHDPTLPWSPSGKLDFALLRLTKPAGNEPVGGVAGGSERKWLRPSTRSLQAPRPLFVIQHPDGRRLELAFDMLEAVSAERVRYRTNTDHGSSGSPCFNEHWELVALHQGYDAPLNVGIPFSHLLSASAELRQALGM